MIKFENSEIMGWEAAIRGITAKGYRKTTNGKYEAFVSNHSKSIYLGTTVICGTDHRRERRV